MAKSGLAQGCRAGGGGGGGDDEDMFGLIWFFAIFIFL
jgi:hypothetical protein